MNTLNFHSIFRLDFWHATAEASESTGGINWATIIFIAGMMIMVEGMGKAGFFRWLCLKLAKLVNYRPVPIFVVFMLMAAFLSMFIDSITVILFLAAVTVELCQLLKCNPVPMILSEVFCANLGGSATMCGDPPNIIIGTSLHYTFSDFLTNTGVIAGISLVAAVVYFYICFRRQLAAAVVLLITHASTGLTVAFIGVLVTVLTLIVHHADITHLLEKVDYKTLLFFIGLFIVAVILWISAAASAFVDNIPFAATMIPVVKALSQLQGIDLSVLAWTLSMGTDIGGSATPIGASATIMVVLISMVCIYVRYF